MIYAIQCIPDSMSSLHILKSLRADGMEPTYVTGNEPLIGVDVWFDPKLEGARYIYVKYEEPVSDQQVLKANLEKAINSFVLPENVYG